MIMIYDDAEDTAALDSGDNQYGGPFALGELLDGDPISLVILGHVSFSYSTSKHTVKSRL
jgi:hypothetical protein